MATFPPRQVSEKIPPRILDAGSGSLAPLIVPLLILAAFVVSVVALVANETPLVFVHVTCPVEGVIIQSPTVVNPAKLPPLLYCNCPEDPPGVPVPPPPPPPVIQFRCPFVKTPLTTLGKGHVSEKIPPKVVEVGFGIVIIMLFGVLGLKLSKLHTPELHQLELGVGCTH